MPFRKLQTRTLKKKRKYSLGELKWQVDKVCSRMRVNLGLAFTRFQTLKERLGMKRGRRVGLLSVGQIGVKHGRLAC